jgi:AcrR family transcriptional regulator
MPQAAIRVNKRTPFSPIAARRARSYPDARMTEAPPFRRARSPEAKAERRRALIAAAAALMDEGGAEAVTLGALAARAGMVKSAVYGYFASREEILLRLMLVELEDLAAELEAALAPLAGAPDGLIWHPRGCPALDPATRMCRAYEARPAICRSFHSTDAAACEANARGEPVPGARLAGAQLTYLAAHGLARAALAGRARVDTFSLFDLAAAAVAGMPLDAAMKAARHVGGALDAERRRTGRALARTAPGRR